MRSSVNACEQCFFIFNFSTFIFKSHHPTMHLLHFTLHWRPKSLYSASLSYMIQWRPYNWKRNNQRSSVFPSYSFPSCSDCDNTLWCSNTSSLYRYTGAQPKEHSSFITAIIEVYLAVISVSKYQQSPFLSTCTSIFLFHPNRFYSYIFMYLLSTFIFYNAVFCSAIKKGVFLSSYTLFSIPPCSLNDFRFGRPRYTEAWPICTLTLLFFDKHSSSSASMLQIKT